MKKKIIISIIALLSLLTYIINYKYSNNELSDNNNLLAVYIDDQPSDKIPAKDSGYILDKYECSDDAQIKWNYDAWSLVLKNFKKGTKCTYYFKKGSKVIVDNKLDEGSSKEDKKIDDETIGVEQGKKVGDLETPTKEGYTFEGWYDENNNPVSKDTLITEGMKLTAKWTINTYELTIKTNGGTINGSTETIKVNLKYKEQYNIKTKTKKGYTFKNFDISNNNTTISENVVTMGSANTTITANWTINSYTLTINTNCKNAKTTKTVKYNETINIEEPKCEGYTYSGFDLDKGVYENNKYTATDSNATLSYKWTANKYPYIVRHYKQNVDGQNYTLVTSDTKEDQAVYNTVVTPETKTYTGFTSPAKKSITIKVDDKSYKYNKVDYNYARNKYTLTINANGGSYSGNKTNTLYYEQTATINAPSKTCYTFVNWTPSSGTLTDNVFKMGTSNATLTANYQIIKYTLTYNVNGGNALNTNTKSVNCGETIGTLPTPVRSGYTFDGWWTEATGGQKITESVQIDRNTTIFAHWLSDEYTVKFDINGGSGRYNISSAASDYKQMPNQTFKYGESKSLSKNDYFKNSDGDYIDYSFAGWAETPNGDVKYQDQEVVSNLTSRGNTKILYAKYKLIEQHYVKDQQSISTEVNNIICFIHPKDDNIEIAERQLEFTRATGTQEENVDITLNPEECYSSNMQNCEFTRGVTIKIDWKTNTFDKYYENQQYIQTECIGRP